MMKKRILTVTSLLTAAVLGLAGCSGLSSPSEDKIKSAISDGTLTLEDALAKGFIDEKWIEENTDRVEAADKSKSNLIGDFNTETVGGETFTADHMAGLTFVYFFNPESADALHQLEEIHAVYPEIKENGGQILGVLLGNQSGNHPETFGDYDFPIIYYNDSMREAMGSLDEMIIPEGFIGVWNRDRAFLSAWMLKINAESLPEEGLVMANYGKPMAEEESGANAIQAPETGR